MSPQEIAGTLIGIAIGFLSGVLALGVIALFMFSVTRRILEKL